MLENLEKRSDFFIWNKKMDYISKNVLKNKKVHTKYNPNLIL